MITTLANVKAVLGIMDASKDALITLLIPMVESEYLSIRNKPFDTEIIGELLGYGDGIKKEFTLKYPPIIPNTASIYIGGSVVINYIININTGLITFTTAPLAAEKITADYESQNVIYPEGSELTAIQMISHRMTLQTGKEIKSEHIGDYSVTYEDSISQAGGVIGGYPASITSAIRKYTKFS